MEIRDLKLTQNEKKVLKHIISVGRISDTKIAGDMSISQQAVFQIRKRLESLGIIRGYNPIIDYDKIGITIAHFMGVKIRTEVWKELTETKVKEKLSGIPFLYEAFRIPSADIHYILLMGFHDMAERDRFMNSLETTSGSYMTITWSYTTAMNNKVISNPLNLLYHALEGKDYQFPDMSEPLPEK
jgi:Lrp/AsnC family leucine-responsive transcriptional regulator